MEENNDVNWNISFKDLIVIVCVVAIVSFFAII